MKVYVGQTRSRKLIARLERLGFGEMTTRKEAPPRRLPWAFDNGAYLDFKARVPFKDREYLIALDRLAGLQAPDFIVLPDIVAGGMASLRFSLEWVEKLRGYAPVYLAVQDGMGRNQIEQVLEDHPEIKGLFVGGTLRWKIATAAQWVQVAHRAGASCHYARCGAFARVRHALRIGADSLDSALPLWSETNLTRFCRALDIENEPQHELKLTEAA